MPTSNKIVWDASGKHFYETGVDHGVLYPMNLDGATYGAGVPWNGLTAVTESPEGAEVTPLYADNIKYLNLMSAEDFKATIEAYTYPDEFEECDGSAELGAGVKIGQQPRKSFGFAYRTKLGNELNPDLGYKLHLIYGCKAAPSERAYETVNDSPDAITFSWELSTIPAEVTGFKPTAHVEIDSTKVAAAKLTLIEAALFGTDDAEQISAIAAKVTGFTGAPMLLMPNDLIALLAE
ncbi:hypothetical protein [Methanobrevibacter sp.]|uniref:hypothetical protein n=1 Tax=Methanobrevibacter sp. TaxID=66852 RepID=UPI003890612C